MCESQKGLASKCNTVGAKIHDKNESAALQLEGEVALGDLIWVKLQGDSWWPALVVDENGVSESSKPGNRSEGEVLVRLYGSYEYLYADPMKYYSEFKMILEQNNGSFCEIFDKALEQDCPRRKSIKQKRQGSKSTANKRADASKGKKKSNENEVKGNQVNGSNPMDVNDGKELSKSVGQTNSKLSKHHGGKRKLGSNEPSTEELINNKMKKLKPNSPHAEENAKRRNPRRNGSNVEDKARSGTSEQDDIQKKQDKNKKNTSKSGQAKNKAQNAVQKKVTNNKKSAKDEVECKSPKQDSAHRKCRSDSTTSTANRKTSKLGTVQKKMKPNTSRSEKEVIKQNAVPKKMPKSSNSEEGKRGKTCRQGEEQKKVKPNSQSSDGTLSITPKQDKMLKGMTNIGSSERISPGKSPESSTRRMRVMQGLGLIAPSGSPFHKNGLI